MKSALPTARPWLPLTGIFLSLAALLIVPSLLTRVSTGIDRELMETIIPASDAIDELHLALAEEMMLQDQVASGPSRAAETRLYRARGRREAAWERLSEEAASLEAARAVRIRELGSLIEVLERTGSPAERQAAYPAISDELDAIGDGIEQLASERRADIAGLSRMETVAAVLLCFLAFISAMVVVRLDQRVRTSALQATRSLRQQRVLLESSGEGVFGIDAEGTCTFINPAASVLLGYTPLEVVGNNLHALMHHSLPDGSPHPESECPSWRALRLGVAASSGDEVLWRKDGTTIRAEYIASPIVEHGEIRGAVVTVRDVTARLEAEQERAQLLAREQRARGHAERAEQRAKFLADASEIFSSSLEVEKTLESLSRLVVPRIADSCIIYLVDDSGEIQRLEPTHADPKRQRILAEQLEKYPPRLDSLVPPVRRALKLGHSALLQTVTGDDLKARPGDVTHTSVMGSMGLQTLVVAPLRARGRIVGAISFARAQPHYGPEDLTLAEELADRAALAIDNARLYQESRGAAAARNELVAIVSHDLRNPLNVVRMGAQALLRHWPPEGDAEPERQQLAVMQKAAERMNRLIRDLLDLAQIDAGRLTIDASWIDPVQLLTDTQELIQPLALEEEVMVSVEPETDLPRAWGDTERLLQVLSNLTTNAVKFSPPGGVVRLGVRRGENRLIFSVVDSGPGIPPEHLPHIFDRFWQAKHRRYGGVGLGLSIASGIVESHGGTLWVESNVGEGSTFSFSIPAADAGAQSSDARQQSSDDRQQRAASA